MKLTNEFEPIRDWAEAKGIYTVGNVDRQYIKLQEEAGELAKAILSNNEAEIIDAIGDCTVVLTNIAAMLGYNIEDCVNTVYKVIAARTGAMKDGTFVKDEEECIVSNS